MNSNSSNTLHCYSLLFIMVWYKYNSVYNKTYSLENEFISYVNIIMSNTIICETYNWLQSHTLGAYQTSYEIKNTHRILLLHK